MRITRSQWNDSSLVGHVHIWYLADEFEMRTGADIGHSVPGNRVLDVPVREKPATIRDQPFVKSLISEILVAEDRFEPPTRGL